MKEIPNVHPIVWNLKDITDRETLEATIRGTVLEVAMGEVGNSDPTRYFEKAAPCYKPRDRRGKAWCQIFDLYCYQMAQLTSRTWQDQRGFVYLLPTIDRESAKPADMTILERTKTGAVVWHGNLLRYTKGERDFTIDGNTSEGVATRDRDIRAYSPRPIYKSIQPWVDAFVAHLEQIRATES